MKHKNSYKVLGLMSGTSLDGLDLVHCQFTENQSKISFEIKNAITIPYSEEWKSKLDTTLNKTNQELELISHQYGKLLAKNAKDFIDKHQIELDFISSHGHTVFHEPNKGVTLQIGNGPELFEKLQIPVICDFRVQDVKLGGQGAPLVPIGDELLFSEYKYCVNLGGFANLSFESVNGRIAYDICPLNIVMNDLAQMLNQPFDNKGQLARKGTINIKALNSLNQIEYYQKKAPKSLGKEWVKTNIIPLIKGLKPEDALRTFVEHTSTQISNQLNGGEALFTGGGTFNEFMMEEIQSKTNTTCIIPDQNLINFKEALIFALLGYLKLKNRVNCLQSVTGASKNHSSGVIYS